MAALGVRRRAPRLFAWAKKTEERFATFVSVFFFSYIWKWCVSGKIHTDTVTAVCPERPSALGSRTLELLPC